MYKVIKIHKHTATSFIDLLNLETGTQDKVFDDSSVVSYDDFEFMQEGEIYDCKMELFGEFVDKTADSGVEVTILQAAVTIGNTNYFKIMIGSDIYYILESDARGIEVKPRMYYDFTRKDLIQVDNVIHTDCL